MRRHLALALLLLSAAPLALRAQSAKITGRAHAQGDSARVIAGAEVTLLPAVRESVSDTSALRRTLTESDGSFRFTGVADGVYQLRVRRLGFDVRDMDVRVTAQQDRAMDIAMGVAAQQLGSVVVQGKKIEFPVHFAEAYARMAHETGDFFTHEKIDSLHPMLVKDLLRTIPGVQVNDRGLNFQRCQGDPFARGSGSAAPTAIIGGNVSPPTASDPQAAKVQVYLDGTRITIHDDAEHALRDVRPASLQLVEVYRSVSRIPGKYLADACAVILLWTK